MVATHWPPHDVETEQSRVGMSRAHHLEASEKRHALLLPSATEMGDVQWQPQKRWLNIVKVCTLRRRAGRLNPEQRIVAPKSTKLILKRFLSARTLNIYYLHCCPGSLSERLESPVSHFAILRMPFRTRYPNPHATAIGSADLRYGAERACCCAMIGG